MFRFGGGGDGVGTGAPDREHRAHGVQQSGLHPRGVERPTLGHEIVRVSSVQSLLETLVAFGVLRCSTPPFLFGVPSQRISERETTSPSSQPSISVTLRGGAPEDDGSPGFGMQHITESPTAAPMRVHTQIEYGTAPDFAGDTISLYWTSADYCSHCPPFLTNKAFLFHRLGRFL